MFEKIGQKITEILEEMGKVAVLTFKTFSSIFRGRFLLKDVLTQLVRIGVDSVWITVIASGFVVGVFAIQIASEFVKLGAGNYVGGIVGIAVARELAPTMTAIVLAGRVGAAIAAELGTMRVTEQIDALYAMGSDPVKHLIVPRFLACTIMLPVLTIFSTLVGFAGGYFVSVKLVGINANGFMNAASYYTTMGDITGGIIKAVFFGMIIAIVACYRGLQAKGGAKGVGEATTSSVVTALMSIYIANYFLSILLFK
ncbi:MAG: ABC transporter permease [Candidatus Saganbacteria bacterium]|nr:ABC transporter permease [Candidatus Saganbacteria bacterium]